MDIQENSICDWDNKQKKYSSEYLQTEADFQFEDQGSNDCLIEYLLYPLSHNNYPSANQAEVSAMTVPAH